MDGLLTTLGLLALLLGSTYLIQVALTLAYWTLAAAVHFSRPTAFKRGALNGWS